MFDSKYNIIPITDVNGSEANIIPITEAYELGQSLLASEPFTSVPRGASTLVGVKTTRGYVGISKFL